MKKDWNIKLYFSSIPHQFYSLRYVSININYSFNYVSLLRIIHFVYIPLSRRCFFIRKCIVVYLYCVHNFLLLRRAGGKARNVDIIASVLAE